MRIRRGATIAVVGALASLCLASAAYAAGPTGNKKAIAFARAEVAAYSHVPSLTYTERGFATMYATLGKQSVFQWRFGSGEVPSGWVKATEHVKIELSKGRVAWWQDNLTPPPCHSFCIQQPVELVLDKAGAFFAFGPSKGAKKPLTCFSPLSGTQPYRLGQPVESLFGDFKAPIRHGSTVLLRSTYPFGSTAHASETEAVDAGTHLVESWRISVSRSTTGSPAFTYSAKVHYPGHPLKAPVVKLCHH